MSAGPGPPKSPAPHPPRRGNSVKGGRLARYRSVREHKSVLDFGRDWRDWEVDIFQDDDAVSNATTETGTATSIGAVIGIAVDDDQQQQRKQQTGTVTTTPPSSRSSAAARRRTAPPQTPLQSRPYVHYQSSQPPQSRLQSPSKSQLQSQWQWQQWRDVDVGATIGEGSPVNRAVPVPVPPTDTEKETGGKNKDASGALARPESPVRFSYPNRRRPKTAPNGGPESPLQGGPDSFPESPPRPPSEPGSLFSLACSSSGSRSPAPGASTTKDSPYPLGPPSAAGSALLPPAASASAAGAGADAPLAQAQAQTQAQTLAFTTYAHAPPPAPIEPPPPPPPCPVTPPPLPPAVIPRDHNLPPLIPLPQLRPRSHNPILVSTSSSCADLKLSARADHARSQIITKLNLHPIPSRETLALRDAEWERLLAREQEQRRLHQHQLDQDVEDRRRKEQEQEEAARWANEVARLEAETDRILAEQKRKDLARLQAQLAAVPDPPQRLRSPIVDKFAFFLRKGRKSDPATLSKSPPAFFQPLSVDYRPVSTMDPSRFIQPGGGGIVPQVDAPTSASNAGERRVAIRCMQSSISLPVTPDTTPMDILYSAANLMTQNINPKTSVVMECYFAFGLERRLRRYEQIRDIMNSWDRDSQHCLLIIPGDAADKYPELNLEGVPRTIDPPHGFVNFSFYHCSRPGKWNKRYITLTENGQVFSAKKKDAKTADKDALSLCHLSDFDLYSVTEKDMLKQIRAPKKNTFAVKSQQKSSVFQNTENFIHFFSTDDAKLAEDFKKLVHAWRSWYLVNKKVDLSRKKKSLHSDKTSSNTAGLSRSGTTRRHQVKVSVDETPYTIGTFSPLLDMDRFEKPIEEFGKDLQPEKPAQRHAEQLSVPRQQHKVVSRSRTTPNLASPVLRKHIDPFARDQEFKTGGLLGRGYEGRKQQAEKNAAAAATEEYSTDSAFTGGQSLLNKYPEPERQPSGMPERRGTVRASRSTAAMDPMPPQRSRSRPPASRPTTSSRPKTSDGPKREMPQPLVDLTPKVPDLPSAWRDGQGRGVRAPNGTPLIQMATGWDNQPDATMSPQLATVTRMATTKAYPPQRMASQSAATRPRSRSTAGGGAPVRRVVSNEQPPIPSLPRRTSRQDDEDVPLINFVDPARGRDARPHAPLGLGRSGTVRH
ncbi:hypothetical protein CPLU01_03745 [Colletotrichum plurivorum]|uniref:PH domain-containing protein n=1 Tax=Colletotrichum plurivorum TaxID=2175906 RepID=A0A8H6KRB9_9PEZI|nr:hypothetical protein CPLU01_03745 [Colletotrichum plurivorum]